MRSLRIHLATFALAACAGSAPSPADRPTIPSLAAAHGIREEAPPPPPPASGGGRYSFVTFGRGLLEECALIVRGRARSVLPGGASVIVARIEIDERLLGADERPEVTVLASPSDLHAGQSYLMFLRRLGSGGRYALLRRIAEGERDYAAKLRVVRRFAEVHRIEDDDRRERAIRDVLIEHLADDDLFVRWNAATELRAFIPGRRDVFGNEERARLVQILNQAGSPTFRREVSIILSRLGAGVDANDVAGASDPPGQRVEEP